MRVGQIKLGRGRCCVQEPRDREELGDEADAVQVIPELGIVV